MTKGVMGGFELPKGRKGDPLPAIPLDGYADQLTLAALTAAHLAVPSGATIAYFTPTDPAQSIKVQVDSIAVWSGDVTDGTAPVVNPEMRTFSADVATISIISDVAGTVGIEWGTY